MTFQGRSATSERPCMTFQGRSATSERTCMVFMFQFTMDLLKNVLKRFQNVFAVNCICTWYVLHTERGVFSIDCLFLTVYTLSLIHI